MHPFDIEVQRQANGTIARLRGSAENAHARDIHDALAELLSDRASPVVIDLRELSFIASATLAELISFRQQLTVYGGQLRLAGANDQVRSVFRQTHLSDLFPMYPSAEDALKPDTQGT